MKTIQLFAAIFMLLFLGACTKEGPIGPQGETGVTGPQGAPGLTGNTGLLCRTVKMAKMPM